MEISLIFSMGFFVRNRDRNVHQYNVRNADELYVPYARLDVRKFSLRLPGAKLWNALPSHIKESSSIGVFKQNLKNYPMDDMLLGQTHHQKWDLGYDLWLYRYSFIDVYHWIQLCTISAVAHPNLLLFYLFLLLHPTPTNLCCHKRGLFGVKLKWNEHEWRDK